jgi:hypothetical protein
LYHKNPSRTSRKRFRQEFKKTGVMQESQEKKESVKNTRTQESYLAMYFLPRQTRLYLHGSCQKDKICFFRQESCIEGMAKESCLIIKKNKNLERSMARTSISDNSMNLSKLLLNDIQISIYILNYY